MKPSVTILVSLITFVGLSAFGQAPSRAFRQEDGAYRWQLILGDRGALALFQLEAGNRGRPVAMVLCDSTTRGGVQLWDVAVGPSVTVTANDRQMIIPVVRRDVGDIPAVWGDGAIPEGWLEALAATPAITLAHGDVRREFAGPGAAVVDYFRTYCASLA